MEIHEIARNMVEKAAKESRLYLDTVFIPENPTGEDVRALSLHSLRVTKSLLKSVAEEAKRELPAEMREGFCTEMQRAIDSLPNVRDDISLHDLMQLQIEATKQAISQMEQGLLTLLDACYLL